jgi:DHA2 family multidrug resistance protein
MTLIPRGAATIVSSFLVGRLVARMDSRLIILAGIVLTAAGFLIMAGLSPQADNRLIMFAAFVQGVGQGTFFVPISTIAFATLAPQLRTEAAAAFGLIRNMGTSVGVSLVAMMHSASAYRAQSLLGEHLTEEAFAGRALTPGGAPDPAAQADLAVLARELARQADLLAYVNTFHLMAAVCAVAVPLLLLLRPPPR